LLPVAAQPFYAVASAVWGNGAVKRVTGRGEKQVDAERDVLLELNARVHEAARRFEGVEPGRDPWDFTCECGVPDCRAQVSLTLAEYEALRAGDRLVVAPGHQIPA
jgi:hypothetical protein